MREIEVFIDTEEIAEFFFHELVKRGYVPTEEELEEIADITFEYLIEKSIIDEEVEDEQVKFHDTLFIFLIRNNERRAFEPARFLFAEIF